MPVVHDFADQTSDLNSIYSYQCINISSNNYKLKLSDNKMILLCYLMNQMELIMLKMLIIILISPIFSRLKVVFPLQRIITLFLK